MILEANNGRERYTFKATPFMDDEERLYFLVKLPTSGFVLMERTNSGWRHVSGENIPSQLQLLICSTIDSADARQLMIEPYPFDQLHAFYHQSLFKDKQ